jgi:hypothetical protein
VPDLLFSISKGSILRSLLRRIGFLTEVRQSRMLLAGIQGCSDWTPDPFDVAQGRGEHGRTTIKTLGGDNFGICSHKCFLFPVSLLREVDQINHSLKANAISSSWVSEILAIFLLTLRHAIEYSLCTGA